MGRISFNLLLVFILISCQPASKTGYEEKFTSSIKVNQNLVDAFFRDDYLQPDNPDFQFKEITNISFDLNNNSKKDTIKLMIIEGFESDPGDFRRITISMDNGVKWTETEFGGWVKFNSETTPDSVKRINQSGSDYLLISEFNGSKLIGLTGYSYASDPGLLTLIDFSTGNPRVIFNKKSEFVGLDSESIKIKMRDQICLVKPVNNQLKKICE